MYRAIQHSALSGFTYDLFDSDNIKVGELCWPDLAIATNARFNNPLPGVLNSTIEIHYNGHTYEIAFEYLNRDWYSDIRFTLLSEGVALASADVVVAKGFLKRPTITVTSPFAGQVLRKGGWCVTGYEVVREGGCLGTIAERSWLMVQRELIIELPDSLSAPVQFFMFFLVHNHAYR